MAQSKQHTILGRASRGRRLEVARSAPNAIPLTAEELEQIAGGFVMGSPGGGGGTHVSRPGPQELSE
jgi:hypothetical protein